MPDEVRRNAGVVPMYVELASQWRELADKIERSER